MNDDAPFPFDEPSPHVMAPQTAPPTNLRARRRVLVARESVIPDRMPPNSPEAERGVLGCMLLQPQIAVPEAISLLGQQKRFYDLRNQLLFDKMSEMFSKAMPVDVITLQQFLRDSQPADDRGRPKDGSLMEMVGGLEYISSLPDAVPSAANLSYYANIVTEKWVLRRAIQVCTDTISRIYDHAGEVDGLMDKTEADILSIRAGLRRTESCGMKELVRDAVAEIERLYQKSEVSGITTGFSDLDKLTGGFQNGDMIIIAARPSVGKSSIAMNIAEHVAVELKLPVGVFSLEMTKESLTRRMICGRARVNLRSVRDGFLMERDFPRLTGAAGRLSACPIRIDDTAGLSIMELRARARTMYQQYGIRLFVVDYLQLLQSQNRNGRENRQQEVAEISRGMKALAKELNVPVIVLSQLNRDLERDKNRKPRLCDLRESGSLEQDADVVGLLYIKRSSDDEDSEECEAVPVTLAIAKSRNGPTGDVYLTFIRPYTRFESAAKISGDDIPEQRELETNRYQPPYPQD